MAAESATAGSAPALYQGVAFRRASRSVLIALLSIIVVPSIVDGKADSVGGVAGLVIFAACVAAVWEGRLRRMGIRIEPHRVVAVYAIGRRRFPIDQVAGFSLRLHGSSGGTRCVFIELVNGKRRVVPSVSLADWGPFKNQAIRWDGGQTTDVVAYLNEQLASARRSGAAGT